MDYSLRDNINALHAFAKLLKLPGTPTPNHIVGAIILTLGKELCPDRFPKISRIRVEMWGDTIEWRPYIPPYLYKFAVMHYARETVGDKLATPRDILNSLRIVTEKWEFQCPGEHKQYQLQRKHNIVQRALAAGRFDCEDDDIARELGYTVELGDIESNLLYAPVLEATAPDGTVLYKNGKQLVSSGQKQITQ